MLDHYTTQTTNALTAGKYSLSDTGDYHSDNEPFMDIKNYIFLGLAGPIQTNQIPRKLLKKVVSVDFYAKQDDDADFEFWAKGLSMVPITDVHLFDKCQKVLGILDCYPTTL